jgi:hypothetical protein
MHLYPFCPSFIFKTIFLEIFEDGAVEDSNGARVSADMIKKRIKKSSDNILY